ncbi:MAG: hypothetical protein M3Q56_06375, partial [Bacteroidota bacterium]|nr:hypothetical protein [Bacteroidota bacterium]
MEKINSLHSYNVISNKWSCSDMDSESAMILTLEQVRAFEEIVCDDAEWVALLAAFNKGRDVDAWLATDWPDGFDELLLCVPLCKLVEFECNKCTIGRRQENNSCAHDYSLFGYIAELLKIPDREGLIAHIDDIKKML